MFESKGCLCRQIVGGVDAVNSFRGAHDALQTERMHDGLLRSGAPPRPAAAFRRSVCLDMLRASNLALLCLVVALAAAACGQTGSGGDGDPASLVPARAPFYLEAAVQPQDERRDDALAAAGKIMRADDPAGKLRELIDRKLAEQGDALTRERDFASWLGARTRLSG
jgi:hypothetical protein